MTDKIVSIFAMTALAAAPAIFAATASADEHSGTWELSPAKSKFSPGPAPRNLTERIVLDENSYKVEATGAAADRKPMHIEFNAKFDGKDYPISGVPWADVVAVKRIDSHTPQAIQKRAGKVTMTITCKVSTDGKTRTCTFKGKDEQGRNVNNVAVFDRQ